MEGLKKLPKRTVLLAPVVPLRLAMVSLAELEKSPVALKLPALTVRLVVGASWPPTVETLPPFWMTRLPGMATALALARLRKTPSTVVVPV